MLEAVEKALESKLEAMKADQKEREEAWEAEKARRRSMGNLFDM